MRTFPLVGCALVAIGASAADGVRRMDLEWNVNYPADIAYEVEINTNKIASGNGGFAVVAKGADGERPLTVTTLAGSRPDAVALRFVVPSGTTALMAEAGVGTLHLQGAEAVENLFAGALASAAPWTADGQIRVSAQADGLHFVNPGFTGYPYAKCKVAVPDDWRGRNVRFEMDCVSEAKMVWAGFIRICQYSDEAATQLLPSSVTDPRWTSHFRPPFRDVAYRVNGHIHPEAKAIQLMIELRSTATQYNAKGLPLVQADDALAKLRVSHLALRRGEELPFPKYDASFFVPGPSGRPGDTALRVGDSRKTAFFYATHGQAVWAEGKQVRDERELFFPTGSGTVEAQFLPMAWPKDAAVSLFDAHTGYLYHNVPDRGQVLGLAYQPKTKTLTMSLMDMSNTVYRASAVAELPLGAWTHLAVAWTVGGTARLFMNGHEIASTELVDFHSLDLQQEKRPNEAQATEFYLASNYCGVRRPGPPAEAAYPLFCGAVDGLRVSAGARYAADFTPELHPSADASTRALFNFDHSFDGVSGSGDRLILGSVRSLVDRVDHHLRIGNETIAYYPEQVLPEHDPEKVLDACNYPNLPTPREFAAARIDRSWHGRVDVNKPFVLTAPEGTVADFVEYANGSQQVVRYPFLLNAGEVDARSFGDLRETLALAGKSDRERANAVFQFVMGASDYFMNHTAYFPDGSDVVGNVEYRELMMLNGYCGFECGPLNNMTASLLTQVANLPASQTAGYRHSFEQVLFDGKNHIYDLSSRTFFPAMDNESSAYLRETSDQPGCYYRLGATIDHFVRQITRPTQAFSPKYGEKIGFVLNPGERFRAYYDNNGEVNDLQCNRVTVEGNAASRKIRYDDVCHAVRGREGSVWRIDRFFPHYGNGFFLFEGRPSADNPAFAVEDGAVVYRVRSCYPIVAADYAAKLTDGRVARLDISTDNGKTWRALPNEHLRYQVRARTSYLVRIAAPLESIASFRASTEVMFNARIFPGRMHAGVNRFRLREEGTVPVDVTIGYRVPAKTIEILGGAFTGTIIGNERQLVVLDPSRPLKLAVKGAGDGTTVTASAGIRATLDANELILRADGIQPGLGTVILCDGEAKRELTVLVSPNVRLVTADDRGVVLTGSAQRLPADATRVQPCVNFTDASSQATFGFAPLPPGKYAVLQVVRFPCKIDSPMEPRLAMTFGGRSMTTARYDNYSANYLKAHYGRTGRSAFKWDYPFVEKVAWYNDQLLVWEPQAPVADVKFKGLMREPAGVELAAVLVVPVEDRAFFCDLVKVLCGLNTRLQLRPAVGAIIDGRPFAGRYASRYAPASR